MRRTTALIKALRISARNKEKYGYGIPRYYSCLIGTKAINLPINNPKYRTKQEFLSDKDSRVFAELYTQNTKWFYQFADDIFQSEVDKKYPFYNPDLDLCTPGISAFRVYDSDFDFIQVQVSKISGFNSIFQLDYYEKEKNGVYLKAIILCDMSNSDQTILDIVYGTSDIEYARKICTTFRCMLIYMRPWDYSQKFKHCEVVPMFDAENMYWNS